MSRGSKPDWARSGGALGALSVPPERRWPDGVLHHGARVGLLLLLALAVSFFFPPETGPDMARYEVGMVADEDIIASLAFGVPKNPDELEREREGAAAAVPPTFERRPAAVEEMEEDLASFFERVSDAAEAEEPDSAVDGVMADYGIPANQAQREVLVNPSSRATLATAARRATDEILPRGVMDEGARLDPSVSRILEVGPEGVDRYLPRDSIFTAREFYEAAAALLPVGAGSEADELLRFVLIRFLNPTLRYDATSTERDRNAARQAVPTTRATVLQGEAVVRANQQVGESEVERLAAYEEALRAQGQLEDAGLQIVPFAGSVLLNFLILGVFGVFLFLFRPEIYTNIRWVALHGILILAFTGAGGLIARHDLPVELLPIAFASLAVAVLWDGRIAIILTATLAALAGAQIPFQSVHAWLPVFVAGAAAGLSVRAVRRRAQTWVFIAIIAAVYFVVVGTLGVASGRDLSRIALSWSWAGGNAVVSAILAMGFLPVFEWYTRITTDQTLLEWADPNRPLLKRLSMEAPGTYAHTINVANLSESAANAIGANGLLCRVGVYYHDVGKMLKPQYFIENQPGGRNPHDKLKPATSAQIVREHVTEGIRLGREANLPDVLMDFIPEHHGTQEISFFHEKARAEAGEDETIDPADFRYPGPRPRSRETAIVMLADSVESATRTLQDPTPERVRELIATIVDGKIEAGQLDLAPLTLQDIGTIKGAFEKVLAGLYHHRIDYPKTRHLTESPSRRTDSAAEAPGDDPVEEPEGDDDPRGHHRPPTPRDAARTSGAVAPPVAPTRRAGLSDPAPSLFPSDDPAGGEDGDDSH
ncbi:MAG: HDIG domain-containing protein [Gemmatimonadales bacterium]|nr:MAG: HDIG domain-containing protein [Gemmatimonadales bacterium]